MRDVQTTGKTATGDSAVRGYPRRRASVAARLGKPERLDGTHVGGTRTRSARRKMAHVGRQGVATPYSANWTAGFAAACAACCDGDRNGAAGAAEKTTSVGQIASSTRKGCTLCKPPMRVSFNPLGGNTINRRAGCGKTASPVRREGGPGLQPALPTPTTQTPLQDGRDGAMRCGTISPRPWRARPTGPCPMPVHSPRS